MLQSKWQSAFLQSLGRNANMCHSGARVSCNLGHPLSSLRSSEVITWLMMSERHLQLELRFLLSADERKWHGAFLLLLLLLITEGSSFISEWSPARLSRGTAAAFRGTGASAGHRLHPRVSAPSCGSTHSGTCTRSDTHGMRRPMLGLEFPSE